MPDFPTQLRSLVPGGVITSVSTSSFLSDVGPIAFLAEVAGVWPAANRALYMPFAVEETVTAYQMATEVSVQSGNCDVGIYDENANRLVSTGSTAVGAAGIQVFNITDTVLTPGTYFMAMSCDNVTASFLRFVPTALWTQTLGLQQEALGSVTLPATAAFANPASGYHPVLSIALVATI